MEDLINLISSGGREWGWVAVVLVWLIPKVWIYWQQLTQRRWNQENRRDERAEERSREESKEEKARRIKIDELYERLLESQQRTLEIIAQNTVALQLNSKALAELKKVFQTEMPLLVNSVRDLMARVERLEKQLEERRG